MTPLAVPRPASVTPMAVPRPAPIPVPTAGYPAAKPPSTPIPAPAGNGVNVKQMFTDLFGASGPRAVAPPGSAVQVAAGPIGSLATAAERGALGASAISMKAAVVYFTVGSATLSRESRKTLRKAAALYRERGRTVRVVGHASSRTRELSVDRHTLVNFNVSIKRAHAVADELIRLGVPANALHVGARSDNEPIYHESMPSGEAGNRRAEVFIDF